MTARQIRLFYAEALRAQAMTQADRLDAASQALTGKPSPQSQAIRNFYDS